jgi:hypothetical protein
MLRRNFSILALSVALSAKTPESKLEPALQAVYDAWKAKGDDGLRAEALARGVSLTTENMVSVRIAASSEKNVPLLQKAAVKSGSRIVTTDGASLYAQVPISELSKLASRSQVAAVYADRRDQQPKSKK